METTDQAEARVSFGPKPYQSIPAEVASMLLTLWRERAPATFGAYLAEVLTGERPSASRKPVDR
jgi:hypothetical protein